MYVYKCRDNVPTSRRRISVLDSHPQSSRPALDPALSHGRRRDGCTHGGGFAECFLWSNSKYIYVYTMQLLH